jgi:hypothetical protein
MKVGLVLVLCLSPSALAEFRVLEEESQVRVRDDRDLQLTCTGSEEWHYCRWSFFSRSCARTASNLEDQRCNIDPERISWMGMPQIDQKYVLNRRG